MNTKFVKAVVLTITSMVLFACPQIANAEPPVPNISGDLEVNIVGKGTVTGTGISCPGDCAQSATWRENEVPTTNTLVATNTSPGWAFVNWTGDCIVQANKATCKSGYGTEEPFVSTARFIDVMAPSIYLSSISPADEVGDFVDVGVVTSDNDAVTKLDYLIDGQVVKTLTAAPWQAELDTTGLSEGVHQLQARAFDPSGNNGITANWPITVDHTAPMIDLGAPVTATNETSPAFIFTSSSEDFDGADCDIAPKGEVGGSFGCGAGEPYTEEVTSEGVYVFRVLANDRANNLMVKEHEFVVDRTAPGLAFTSGPADGATVETGDVSYGWSIEDGLAVTQECSVDGGPKAPCDRNLNVSLKKGVHTVDVDATDQAGNTSSISRTVTVKAVGTDPDDPDDPDKPGAGDHTAPVVKLATAKQKLRALRKGLKVKVRCDEACAGTVKAKAKGGVRFTGKVELTAAGVTRTVLKPNAKAKRALKKAKPLKLTVVSRLSDTAGNQAVSKLKTRVLK